MQKEGNVSVPQRYNNRKIFKFKELKTWLLFTKYGEKHDDTKYVQKINKKKNS